MLYTFPPLSRTIKISDQGDVTYSVRLSILFFFFFFSVFFLQEKIPRLHGRFELFINPSWKNTQIMHMFGELLPNPSASSRWPKTSRPLSPCVGLTGLYLPVVSNGSTIGSRALPWNKPANIISATATNQLALTLQVVSCIKQISY